MNWWTTLNSAQFYISRILTLKSGSLRRFMQVEAVGNLSVSAPEFWMQKGGSRSCITSEWWSQWSRSRDIQMRSWPWSPAVAAWSSSSRTWAAPSSGPRPAPSPPGPIRGQYSGHRPIRERYFSSPARTLRWSGGSARSRQRSWCVPEH